MTFAKADAGDAIPGAPFDAVLAFSLLHLVDDLPRTLRAVKDRLKPGGLFVSKTPCIGDRARWMRSMVRALHAFGFAPEVLGLTREGLIEALETAGFSIELTTTFDTAWANPYIVARKA